MALRSERSLNGTWELTDRILTFPLANARVLAAEREEWIPAPVPGDIHQALIAVGRIEEPLLGLNSFDCRWTESRSWWYRKTFSAGPEWLQAEVVELEMNGLDANAELFLNGEHVGSHRNAFYPFSVDLKPWLKEGDNTLLVRLSAGVEDVSEADIDAPDGIRAGTEAERGRPERGDPRRTFFRKPQYSFGWDWSPRVATTAIAGDVTIRAMNEACIRGVSLRPVERDGQVSVAVTVTVDRFHYYRTGAGTVRVALSDQQGRSAKGAWSGLLRSGYNYVEFEIPLADPQFWWPNGMGEQHLYRVEAELEVGEERAAYPAFDYGLRTLELDTASNFAIVINGKRVFCKGANWIPADAIYARVDRQRYETLIREAAAANFNMLRIWGGGRYEDEAFYQTCDRHGIMIWHDFMFACAPYPDHLEGFRIEVEREAEYQTQRLGRHACVVLWSGSNENNWGFRDWWDDQTQGGAWTYNYALPRIAQRNTPEIPYWNGSPYGGDDPNSSEVGDRHHWYDCMMNPEMEKRITPEEYDKCDSLFVSEFGYVGAPIKETVLEYMDGAPLDRQGAVWQHHTNTFEKNTVDAGIRKQYTEPEGLSIEKYLLYSGLCQGLMYSYALDSMRYRANCHGSLFWMYEDCWGEIGWTIIDYYLRRKPAWYFVRRAYAPLRLILRPAGDAIRVVIANDTMESRPFELEYGYVGLDGRVRDLQRKVVEAVSLARTELLTFDRGGHDPAAGLWIARAPGIPEIDAAILRAVDYRQLQTTDPGLSIVDVNAQEGGGTVHVRAERYAHAVHLLLPAGAIPVDDYFDLLPGEERVVRVRSTSALDPAQVGVTCVNEGK
ncbi:MAG: glycoside hydrolase family 2 protein [Anaerolineae bacterium]